MENIASLVRSRRSVRTFDERVLTRQDLNQLCDFMSAIDNPYGIPIKFKVLNAAEQKLGCPVVVGTDLFIGAKMKRSPNFNEAFGYSFEKLVLYAQSLGIGTVWIGGTMDRKAFEKAMELAEDEVMPCISPIGYPAAKMSLRESMMRKGVKANERLPFEKVFFDGSFDTPLAQERAGKLNDCLEAVRLAPSAVNKQPWRVVLANHATHFYLMRSKGFRTGVIDMQKIDIGIAMCHFDLTAKEAGLAVRFVRNSPDIKPMNGEEYIASFEFDI